MPIDRVWVYTEAVQRRVRVKRKIYVVDTASSIGGAFSKDGVTPYLDSLDKERE